MDIYNQIAQLGSNLDPVGSYMQGRQWKQQNELAKMKMAQAQQEQETKNQLLQLRNQLAVAAPESRNAIIGNMYAISPEQGKAAKDFFTAPTPELVEVFDPQSPTKSRYVPKAQAVNQPGRERIVPNIFGAPQEVIREGTNEPALIVTDRTGNVRDLPGYRPMPNKGAANKGQMPTAALKMQQEELDAIGTASGINANLAKISGQIDSGDLDLGPVSNLISTGRNFFNQSTPQSANFASFKASLEKLRNDSLRLNKGVQTDGDAQRAWNELFDNINSPEVVKQRLAEISELNERAASIRKMNVENIRSNYNLGSLDTSGYEQPSAANGAGDALTLTLPDGRAFKFKDKQSLEAYKKAARL